MTDISRRDSLHNLTRRFGDEALAPGARPVEHWNPPFCGDIDMRIGADGTWFYGGTPIGRPALVKLFASILRKDPDRFVLVTPVEKVGISVEDAPFIAVEMDRLQGERGPALAFRTNVDDRVTAGVGRPLRFEREPTGGLRPYILVRGELWARLTRPLAYALAECGEIREVAGERVFGVASAGAFFPMAPAAEIEDLP